MELTQMLLTGSLGGLVSVLAHSALWSAVGLARGSPVISRAEPSAGEALLHMACGIALALLFWLSWGLAAISDPRWWVRGVWFGLLTWAALVVPTIGSIALTRSVDLGGAALLASRWGTTALTVGLACAWSWDQAV
jgi:hypothetical protein